MADEMRDHAKEHDSKFGIVTALYTQANLSLKVGMDDRAEELCKQAIDYKNHYLPNINCTHIYWMLAKFHLVKHRLLEALRRTHFENAQQVIESMKQEVEAYRNGAEPNDDFTMMCVSVS